MVVLASPNAPRSTAVDSRQGGLHLCWVVAQDRRGEAGGLAATARGRLYLALDRVAKRWTTLRRRCLYSTMVHEWGIGELAQGTRRQAPKEMGGPNGPGLGTRHDAPHRASSPSNGTGRATMPRR